MTIYDDMRGYVHTHDRNGWFDVIAKTTPMYQMIDKADAENAKLRELVRDYHRYEHEDCYSCRYINECRADESGRCIAPMRLGERYRELGIEVDDGQQRDV